MTKKIILKKQPEFGEPLKAEDLSFTKLTLKEKLLFLASDLCDDADLSLDFVYNPRHYKAAPIFECSKRSLYKLVSQGVKVGDIKKVSKDGQVYLQITAAGREFLKREFPVFRWQETQWDGLWRIVAYDIEEKRRDVRNLLRRKLEELGFGMLQKSLWMTPHDVTKPLREFLESEQLVPEVYVLEARRLFARDDRALAAEIWPLKELNLAYESWLEKVEKVGESKEGREGLREEFAEILKADPCLPKELLPEGWEGKSAAERFRTLPKS